MLLYIKTTLLKHNTQLAIMLVVVEYLLVLQQVQLIHWFPFPEQGVVCQQLIQELPL